jgi:hypothetical protein
MRPYCKGEVAFPPEFPTRKAVSGEVAFCATAAVITAMKTEDVNNTIAPELRRDSSEKRPARHSDRLVHGFVVACIE